MSTGASYEMTCDTLGRSIPRAIKSEHIKLCVDGPFRKLIPISYQIEMVTYRSISPFANSVKSFRRTLVSSSPEYAFATILFPAV